MGKDVIGWKSMLKKIRLGMMVHTYNPSYSRDRDQENQSSRPAQAKS
jgi:hypothetical protein